jgi:uncharacterized membrane protein
MLLEKIALPEKVLRLNKEFLEKIKKEGIVLVSLLILSVIILKLIYFKEDFAVVLRTVASFFWLFVVPGYTLMLIWHEKLSFMERFVVGIALSAGITGIASYYLGLLGLNIIYHTILIPILIIVVSMILVRKN